MFGDPISFVLFLFIFALVTATAILSSGYDLRDKKEPFFFKSLSSSGWLVLIFSFLTLVLTAVQNGYSEYRSAKENKTRDSLIRADYAKSVERVTYNYNQKTIELKTAYDTSTTNIVEALAKYGLKYDTAQNRIEKLIKDSSHITNGPDPYLTFCADTSVKLTKEENGRYTFDVSLSSYQASSKYVTLAVFISAEYANHQIIPCRDGIQLYLGNGALPLGTKETFGLRTCVFKERPVTIIFFIKGEYKNVRGDKQFKIDEMLGYNLNDKISGHPTGYKEIEVRNAFKQAGIQ
jgi:hypothetical protein